MHKKPAVTPAFSIPLPDLGALRRLRLTPSPATPLLKELRELRGLSQEKLAERVGVSLTFIAHIEGGRKSPSFETLELLGRALGVHRYRLLIPPMHLDPSIIEQTTEGLQEVIQKMLFAVRKLPEDINEG